MLTSRLAWPARWPIRLILSFFVGEQSSQKMCDSLPWTPMNRRAIIDAASFILGREIRNRTHAQKTVTYISTPCLSACLHNKILSCSKETGVVPYLMYIVEGPCVTKCRLKTWQVLHRCAINYVWKGLR